MGPGSWGAGLTRLSMVGPRHRQWSSPPVGRCNEAQILAGSFLRVRRLLVFSGGAAADSDGARRGGLPLSLRRRPGGRRSRVGPEGGRGGSVSAPPRCNNYKPSARGSEEIVDDKCARTLVSRRGEGVPPCRGLPVRAVSPSSFILLENVLTFRLRPTDRLSLSRRRWRGCQSGVPPASSSPTASSDRDHGLWTYDRDCRCAGSTSSSPDRIPATRRRSWAGAPTPSASGSEAGRPSAPSTRRCSPP